MAKSQLTLNSASKKALGPSDKFSKPLHTIVVLCIGCIPGERNYTSSQWPRCPIQKNKKTTVFPQLGMVFESQGWVTVIFKRRCNFAPWSSSSYAELRQYVIFFWKCNLQAEIWRLFAGLLGQNEKKRPFFKVDLQIRGQTFTSPKVQRLYQTQNLT